MTKIECINCSSEESPTFLEVLPSSHKEYYLSQLTNDGTKKWYLCKSCGGVFCKDKLIGVWQLSPDTYIDFLKKGIIEDRLNSD